ncbi:uncharacterized protein LOC136086478 [Hydra vulgaris]|uniref:Uncharacterized protein LOC136086478 n=1 Tax=Hydra vulgaris TaxID=6087 RepID=A0ABM4CSF5_HYDVU
MFQSLLILSFALTSAYGELPPTNYVYIDKEQLITQNNYLATLTPLKFLYEISFMFKPTGEKSAKSKSILSLVYGRDYKNPVISVSIKHASIDIETPSGELWSSNNIVFDSWSTILLKQTRHGFSAYLNKSKFKLQFRSNRFRLPWYEKEENVNIYASISDKSNIEVASGFVKEVRITNIK